MNPINLFLEKGQRLSHLLRFDNWVQLLTNRLLFRNVALVLYRKGECEFLVDHAGGDQDGLVHCFVPGLYDPFFVKMDKKKPLEVLDLGANAGGFSLAAKARGLNFSKIIAVELNPFTASRLKFNLIHNFGSKVTILNAGLADEEGKIYALSFGRGSVGDSLGSAGSDSSKGAEAAFEIPSVTFDQLVREHFGDAPIDICKMDVEGEEFNVVLGTHVDLLNRVRNLLIEVHEDASRSGSLIDQKLISLGFIRMVPDTNFFEPNVFWWRNPQV